LVDEDLGTRLQNFKIDISKHTNGDHPAKQFIPVRAGTVPGGWSD
jgi:hypothetical protein